MPPKSKDKSQKNKPQKDKPQKVLPKKPIAAKKKKGKTNSQASTRKRIGVKVARNQDLQYG